MALGGCRGAGQEHPEGSRRPPAEPERLLDSPTYEGFPVRPLYTALTSCPSRRCPVSGPTSGAAMRCATSSRAGRSPNRSRARRRGGGRRQRRAAGRADRGQSARWCCGSATVASPRPSWTACSKGVFLDLVPVILDAGRGLSSHAADAMLALVTDLDDDQRARLSVDLGADPLTAPLSRRSGADPGRCRRDRGKGRRIRRRRARDHRRRSGLPRSRRQRVVGARRQRRRRGRLPAGAQRRRPWRSRMRCGRSVSASPPTTTSS